MRREGLKQGMPTKIEIADYMDYRTYICDLVKMKREEGGFSFRSFCRKSGFASPTYLKWVMDGKRRISPDSAGKFARGLDLTVAEARYFELLVSYQEASQPEVRSFFYEELLHEKRGGQKTDEGEKYEYLSRWHHLAVRELVGHPECAGPLWIRDKLGGDIGLKEVNQSLKVLLRLGLVSRDSRGRLRQKEPELHTEPEVASIAAYRYHADLLNLSREILQRTSHEVREFSSLVSLLDGETFLKIKKMMHSFQEQALEAIREDEKRAKGRAKELFWLNMQLLPGSRFKPDDFFKTKRRNV